MDANIENFMDEAFKEAYLALKNNEVPVGCVFVYLNEVIARGGNEVNATKNATRHAELVCIDKMIDYCTDKKLNLYKVLKEVSVYVTVEPCIMCSTALHQLQVKDIFYGCENDRFGGKTVIDVSKMTNYTVPTRGGFRAEESMALLKQFYEGENPSAPAAKKRRLQSE